MDGILDRIVVFALVGLASGFASGLFGIGGGIVRVPIFVYLLPLFGVAHPVLMHVAVGTSMALVLPSAIASTRKQYALGNLDLSFYRTWALGILIGVLVGLALLPFASTEVLKVIFALFMVTVGVYVGFVGDRFAIAHEAPRGAIKLGVAAAIGCVAALTGTGGGTMVTPMASATDGLLDLCIVEAMTRREFAATALKVKRGEHVGHPGVHYKQLRSVTIDAPEALSVNVDGENSQGNRFTYRARTGDLWVHVAHFPGER